MRILPKIYARALSEVLLAKKLNVEAEKKILHNFLELVEKNQGQKLLGKIAILLERDLLKKQGGKKALVETARKISEKEIKSLVEKLGEVDILEQKISSSLLAGVKVTLNNNLQYDFSLQSKINRLFNF